MSKVSQFLKTIKNIFNGNIFQYGNNLYQSVSQTYQMVYSQQQKIKELENLILHGATRDAVLQLQNRYELLKIVRDFLPKENKEKNIFYKAQPDSFEKYLEKLNALNPKVFPVWYELFKNGERSYYELREASCSLWGNVYAEVFKAFISAHASGHLLDIGSGPHGLPMYLQGYPVNKISVLEPLPIQKEVDFEVVRGFAEFMPWQDKSFSTIVAGTSLDHVLCLDTSLNEIYRVIRDDGCLIVWIGAVHGSKRFDPSVEPVEAIDEYHLFHFDTHWFENWVGKFFMIKEKLTFPTVSFDHVFYCLVPYPKEVVARIAAAE